MKPINLLLLAIILMAASVAHGQTWVKVSGPNEVITVPAGTTVRFGVAADNKWANSVYYSTSKMFTANDTTFNPDPDPKGVHELQVLQTKVAQYIIVGTPTQVMIPATGTTAVITPDSTCPASPVNTTGHSVLLTYSIVVNSADGSINSATATAEPQ